MAETPEPDRPRNRSLIARRVGCPLHETGEPFVHFHLRSSAYEVVRDDLDLPVYRAPLPGEDACDFELLAVTVCPECAYAATEAKLLAPAPGGDFPLSLILPPGAIESAFNESSRRARALEKVTAGFFTEERTLRDAIIAYSLAIETAQSLYAGAPEATRFLLCHCANHHLRLARLCRRLDLRPAVSGHLFRARNLLQRASESVKGSFLIRTLYQTVSLSLSLGDVGQATTALDALRRLARSGTDRLQDPRAGPLASAADPVPPEDWPDLVDDYVARAQVLSRKHRGRDPEAPH